ncbi:MAG: hypothetical protein ACFCD0_19215 [Gemmataceae bacterium]
MVPWIIAFGALSGWTLRWHLAEAELEDTGLIEGKPTNEEIPGTHRSS